MEIKITYDMQPNVVIDEVNKILLQKKLMFELKNMSKDGVVTYELTER